MSDATFINFRITNLSGIDTQSYLIGLVLNDFDHELVSRMEDDTTLEFGIQCINNRNLLILLNTLISLKCDRLQILELSQ
jgi:hypothetical protein